jgi:ribonuclease III
MNDDTPVIEKIDKSGDASQQPDAAPKAARKKKAKKAKKQSSGAKTAALNSIETRIGHKFAKRAGLVMALTHVSALSPAKRNRADSYQRMEFLGDHVLGLVISDMLYKAFPKADEGELSKRLADLVRRESCAEVARSLGLAEDIKLGAVGNASAAARLRESVLGDICEAVIGAIYLDGGYPAAAAFVERHWTERMHKHRRPMRDAKTALQEWAQSRALPTPVYREVERTGPHHDPQFRVAVNLPGLEPAEGVGGSKRAAEKSAALAMLAREVGGKYEG